ncbi:RagB/SusD family nutrient uptake outer membrane protein [Pedobacter sp. BS3]|uniref:RagB/SusD family nutrient uptake outer membrane protein n=1 Tax=Pedobacter sp. BS3 TaxID=2567937 RepID=UPI0011EF1CA5|nr:RagB/SusD family nutrient uptake outer membrane protein [Pedobacter sp. BS3]TZF84772.1 RagB/SusD family nutrient uptake outer membrane protein [Pedobacter sp. BS3]
MNTIYKTVFFILIAMLAGGCKDYLDTKPKDRLAAEEFFNTATDLEVYTNKFYDFLPTTQPYDASYGESSDDVLPLIVPDRIKGSRLVPVKRGDGGWDWANLRSINFFLQNYQKCPDAQAKLKYGGIARFFRAYFYYDKVKTFGDVPWYGKVLEAGDPDLYKARDSRKLVMDSVLADINYAVANIPKEVQLNRITKYTALALKARICLFEGTFRKYHGLGDYEAFLNEAVAAADELIGYNTYKIFTTGGANSAYRELFARNNQDATETILAGDYNPDFRRHPLSYYMTSPTQGSWGMTKDLVNSYLMKDGSRFTDIAGYQTKGFYDEMQNRDPRLTQSTAGPDFVVYGETAREPVNLNITTTGYRVIKALASRTQWGSSSSYNDIILYRYAETLLIYAEAKAELGTLTQADLDKSVNKLRDRVGMPHLNLIAANANPDPYLAAMYPNVNPGANKGVILEIRRERRIELFNEGFRWDDLMRWKEGKKLEKPMLGIYFPSLGAFDFNNDGTPDVYLYSGSDAGAPPGVTSKINIAQRPLTNGTSGNLNPFRVQVTFDESKDYLYPIPQEDITLNPNLKQNPNWGE